MPLARFSANLNLPEGNQLYFDDAAEAVRREYRSCSQWKLLCCRNVEPASLGHGHNLFVLEVGHSIEFDWTWEGAIASRTKDPKEFRGDVDATDDFVRVNASDGHDGVWAGEVVEVDETNGRLFVSVSGQGNRPCTGTFFVRPFEFLRFLHALFTQPGTTNLNQAIATRLAASLGSVHPCVTTEPKSGLLELQGLWHHSWAILWGPPG